MTSYKSQVKVYTNAPAAMQKKSHNKENVQPGTTSLGCATTDNKLKATDKVNCFKNLSKHSLLTVNCEMHTLAEICEVSGREQNTVGVGWQFARCLLGCQRYCAQLSLRRAVADLNCVRSGRQYEM